MTHTYCGDCIRVEINDCYDAIIIIFAKQQRLKARVMNRAIKLIETFCLNFSAKYPLRKVGFIGDWLNSWKDGIAMALMEELSPDFLKVEFVFKP